VQTKQRSLLARLGAAESAPPWSLTAAAFSIAAAVIAMFAGTFVGLAWFDPAPHAGVAGWAVGGIMGALLVYQTRRAQLDALKLGASRTPLLFVMFIALGLALLFDVIGLAVTGVFSPSPELLILSASGTISAAGWFFAVLLMVAAQPAVEELVFRGIALPSLRHALGGWGGLIVCAALSAGFHLLIYPPNYAPAAGSVTPIWYGAALPFLDALALCIIRVLTGSTRAALAAHAIFGLFAVIKLLLMR
jgi:membrane protease YdiL (CAAX protease family)